MCSHILETQILEYGGYYEVKNGFSNNIMHHAVQKSYEKMSQHNLLLDLL